MAKSSLIPIGWEEWISLPQLKLPALKAKVDTGAKTSALHAFRVDKIEINGQTKVRFGIHPIPERLDIEVTCVADLVSEREVTSSSGQTELRYVIRTMAQFGDHQWPIEITLTDRETLAYRMLIGRSAMKGRLVVVPEASFLLGKLSPKVYESLAKKSVKRRLKIALLTNNPLHYTTKRLVAAAKNHHHHIEVIQSSRCYVEMSAQKPLIHYQGEKLPRFDVVIPRIEPTFTYYGVAILRQFESLGTFCLNNAMAISHARDNLYAHQLLGRSNIPMPVTAFGHYPGDTKDMIKIVGGAPLLIKLLEESSAESVLAETQKAASAVIRAFRGLNANFIVQKYIQDPHNRDLRCIVLGNKVIAAVMIPTARDRMKGDDKDKVLLIELTPAEKKIAIRSVRILGLKFAAVTLLRTSKGPQIIEIDPSPPLRRIEAATGVDMARMIIQYLETHARPKMPKRLLGHAY